MIRLLIPAVLAVSNSIERLPAVVNVPGSLHLLDHNRTDTC